MANKCLYCYEEVNDQSDFHEKCSMEFFGTATPPQIEYTLDQMGELAKGVVERSVTVPGVQPKISMTVVNESTSTEALTLTVVGALGGNYILKPPSDLYPEMAENEHLTMRMAQDFGLRVVPSSLVRLASGELSYITKRIDRTPTGGKIHMLDMFQITEALDKYKSSMEKVGRAINDHSSNTLLDKTYLFDMLLFSFITGNNDMHLKNFSLIQSNTGWVLAPAYDLLNVSIVLPEDKDELALALCGIRRKLERAHFEEYGQALGLIPKQISRAFDRLVQHQPTALQWIQRSVLSTQMKEAYIETLDLRYQQLGLGKA